MFEKFEPGLGSSETTVLQWTTERKSVCLFLQYTGYNIINNITHNITHTANGVK